MTDPVDFIPAGCCCEQSWYGKRPAAAPLTDTFIRTAVKGGSIVPPSDFSAGRRQWGAWIVAGMFVLSAWSLIHFFG